MTHTPGPWITNDFGLMRAGIYDEHYPAQARYGVHVEFYPLFNDVPDLETDEFIANMQILGASLDLLKACKLLRQVAGDIQLDGNRTLPVDDLRAAFAVADAAIAKAEGE